MKWKKTIGFLDDILWIAQISTGTIPLFAVIFERQPGQFEAYIRNTKFILANVVGYDPNCQKPPKTLKAMKEIVEKTVRQLEGLSHANVDG